MASLALTYGAARPRFVCISIVTDSLAGCYGRPTLFFLSSFLGLDPSRYSLLAVQHTFSCCPCWLSQPMLISAFLCSAEPVAANSLSFSCLMYTALPPRGYTDYSI